TQREVASLCAVKGGEEVNRLGGRLVRAGEAELSNGSIAIVLGEAAGDFGWLPLGFRGKKIVQRADPGPADDPFIADVFREAAQQKLEELELRRRPWSEIAVPAFGGQGVIAPINPEEPGLTQPRPSSDDPEVLALLHRALGRDRDHGAWGH